MTKLNVTEFRGNFRFLSNFALVPIAGPGNYTYPSVEHAYQAYKSTERKDWLALSMDAEIPLSAADAKRYGQKKIKVRDDWESVKLMIMEQLVREKFLNDTEISKTYRRMLSLIDGDIIEGNTWGDIFWGVDSRTTRGENHLGKILMKLRDEINVKEPRT